jgi:predicted nucleic-acid-binding Zn-ribbon protein
MDIKVKIPLKCSKCGGAKYIDEPYLISDTWFVDIVCLSCGDTKIVEQSFLKSFISKLQGGVS